MQVCDAAASTRGHNVEGTRQDANRRELSASGTRCTLTVSLTKSRSLRVGEKAILGEMPRT
eukprot:scaffold59638_cov29-Tisochrysis_lutea.AAC.4